MPRIFSDPFVPGLSRADQAEHLILPWAASDSPKWWPTVTALPASSTVHLRELLRGMRPCESDKAEADSLNLPHERALARALGWPPLPDGLLPWAALARGSGNTACAWLTLCHWAMGREQATLSDPQWLALSEDGSQVLMQAMLPFFQSEGIGLQALEAGRWLATGEALNLPCASLERVIGRDVDPWLPAGQAGRTLRRLQNEMQMLLYTHPVNEARTARGQPAINSLWFSGAGCLPSAVSAPAAVHMPTDLACAALSNDWKAYGQAWSRLDTQALRPLLERQRAGHSVRLTLCGERGALTLQSAAPTLWQRITPWFQGPTWQALLKEEGL